MVMKSARCKFRTRLKWISSLVNFLISSSSGGFNGVVFRSRENNEDDLLIGGGLVSTSSESSWMESSMACEEPVVIGWSCSLSIDLVCLLDMVIDLGDVVKVENDLNFDFCCFAFPCAEF